ncbi:MAG: glycerophosphodiester phosphodiesterase family protein [bacterium]|nr:glycerophosphodiester phosphodiesterase family protein [bacterium]
MLENKIYLWYIITMKIIGHRGARGLAPENTLISFKKGLESNADYIEFDIQLTKDNKVAVIHDYSLQRTTGINGLVSEFTLAEIKKADAGAWFSEEFRGQQLPSLEEALDFIIPKAIPVIEIKMSYFYNPDFKKYLTPILEEYSKKSHLIVISFFHPILKELKNDLKNIETAVLYNSALTAPWQVAESVKADAVHPRADSINMDIINELKKRGYPIRPWVINTEKEFKIFLDAGVDALGTDFPNILNEFLSQNNVSK